MEFYQIVTVTALSNCRKMLILSWWAFLILLFQNIQTKPIHVCHKFTFYDVFSLSPCTRFFYCANYFRVDLFAV